GAPDPDARGGDAPSREGPSVRVRGAVARRGRRSPEGAEAAPRRRDRRVTSIAIRAPEAWLGPGRFTRDALVVCEGGKVSWAGRERDAAAVGIGAERILGVDGFLMPAAADRHVHIELADPAAVLARGVTAVRDLAWPADRIFPLADLSELPTFEGPLIRAAGPMLTVRDGYPTRDAWAPAGTGREVTGPDAA